MCYFKQRFPCQALLGGVAGKGCGVAHGLGVIPTGSKRGRGRLGRVVGVGDEGLSASVLARLAAAPPQLDLAAALRTLLSPETQASAVT